MPVEEGSKLRGEYGSCGEPEVEHAAVGRVTFLYCEPSANTLQSGGDTRQIGWRLERRNVVSTPLWVYALG